MTKKIAIDAGHGLGTPGKRVLKSLDSKETREWSLNSRVADLVEKGLRDYSGHKTIRLDDMTGKRDIPLKERTDKANSFGADMLVSIHHNAGINGGSGGGIVVYRYPNSTTFTRDMHRNLYDKLIEHTGLKGNRANPLGEANFHMLRESRMPAVLIENGFMDSSADVPIILTKKHAEESAKAIVHFLASEYKLKKKTAPASGKPREAGGKLYKVQIGDYSKKRNADAQAKKAKGFDTYIAKEGALYKVQIGAYSNKANADKQAQKAKKAGFDVYVVGGGKASSQAPKLSVGDKVKIKSSAKTYATGQTIPAWVKGQTHTIQQVKSDRVLLKEIVSWVKKSDVE